MNKPIFTLIAIFLLLSLGNLSHAQFGLVTIDSVSITPQNPDPTDSVFIAFFGTQTDSCVYMEQSLISINQTSIGIDFQFTNDPAPPGLECIPTLLPWDTTINLGTLAPGNYPLVMGGNNYSLQLNPAMLVVVVPTPSCTDNNGDIWVTSIGDFGVGSLRNAIDCANSTSGPNLIRFNIPGTNFHDISVGVSTGNALPALTDDGTTIDATTQPGFFNNIPAIGLNGASVSWNLPINALWVQGDDCQIFGLEIKNFPDDAIDVMGADNVVIGAAGTGNVIHSNGSAIDYFPGDPGTGPWNGCGIVVREGATGCTILGNTIGTNLNLSGGLGNEWCAINVRDGADNCVIGGLAFGEGNILANNETGIRVNNADNCLMQRNLFICNTEFGIQLINNGNNHIEKPIITNATSSSISGTSSITNGVIEIYSSEISSCPGTPCQGRFLLGTTTVVNGNWSLTAPFLNGLQLNGGNRVTAIVNDGTRTSEFATCKIIPGISACTNADGSIEVTTTNDEGPGSLREAINCANNTPGSNYIRFNIPGNGPHVILVGETSGDELPALTDAGTVIDGATQPGFGVNDNSPQIVLDGQVPDWTAPINALFIRADFCEVYALEIKNFPDDAIDLTAANSCIIGDVGKGNVIINNGDVQDFFPDVPGTGPWNGCGVVLKGGSDNNLIKSNFIGTNFGMTQNGANEYCGVIIQSGNNYNQIGGTLSGEGNVIANNEEAIRISDGAVENSIYQNAIYCNSIEGINLIGAANNSIPVPTIAVAQVDTLSGSAVSSSVDFVEVFINDPTDCTNAPCQGKTYLGTAIPDLGIWMLVTPFANGVTLSGGESITAVAHDDQGNSSEFAICVNVTVPCNVVGTIIDQQDATCGLANGYTTADGSGGQSPYFYDIGNGLSVNPTFTDLVAGEYIITVIDGTGCSTTVETTIGDSPVPVLNIGTSNDATCNQANGSFSAVASGGTLPYSYDIGNGPVTDTLFTGLMAGSYTVTLTDGAGCVDSITTTINDNGVPNSSITLADNPTCGLNNGAITVFASGGTPTYSYDLGNGTTTDPAFTNLAPGTYTITITDQNGCSSIVDTTLINQGVLPTAAFGYNDVDGTVNFNNNSLNGLTYSWDFGDGNSSTQTNPTHTYSMDGNYTVCLTVTNNCGMDQFCENINVVIPLIDVTISGKIYKEDGTTVALVNVDCTNRPGVITSGDGLYTFDGLTAGMDYTITPYKNTDQDNGISIVDLVQIQRHLLFLDTLDFPYDYIAADVSKDQNISPTDLVLIQRLLLFDIDSFPNNTSWRFIDADHVFSNPNNLYNPPIPETIYLPNLVNNAFDQDFIAVKTGDVSGDADPLRLTNANSLTWRIADQKLIAGEKIKVSVEAMDFENIIGLQADLAFDVEMLDLVQIEQGDLTGLRWGKRKLAEGLLPITWLDSSGNVEGLSMENGSTIITLTFEAKSTGSKLSDVLQLTNVASRNMAYDAEEELMPIQMIFDWSTAIVSQPDNLLQLYQNQPNPFSNSTLIPFTIPASGNVVLKVFDITGRTVYQDASWYSSGRQDILLMNSDLPGKGLYFYELDFAGQKAIKRMMLNTTF